MESTQRIRSERSEGKLLFTRRQLELYMRKVAGVFSKEPKAVFDIYKAMVADSAIVGVTRYIVKFRGEVGILSRGDSTMASIQRFVTSLKFLNSLVKQSMFLWISRNVDLRLFPSPKLPPDLRKALEAAKDIIDGEMPCRGTDDYLGHGYTCGTMKHKHKNYHSEYNFTRQDTLAILLGTRLQGDFRAHPEVSNAMEDYGNLVEVAENVFKSVSGRNVRNIRELVLRYRRSAREEYSWLKDFTSYQVCVICVLNLPTEMLSCGHIICDKCAEEAEISPHAQSRLIDLFKHLAGEDFHQKQQNVLADNSWFRTIFMYMRWYDSKYKNDALLRLLKQHLGEQSLLRSCVGGPRVIIPACDYDDECAAAWFTSYSRPSSDNDEAENDLLQKAALREDNTKSSSDLVDGRVSDGYLFNVMEVAAATSAAPTFLPLVRAGDRRWVDGGMRFNGPSMIAIDEAKKLWPERQVCALISLGCGKVKEGSGERTYGVLKILKMCVNIALDAEIKCNSAISFLKELQPVYASTQGPGIRLNVTIDPCELDDAVKMGLLIRQTEEYLTSTVGKADVGRAANLLFAALFHLHIESDEESLTHAQNLENLSIRSCSVLPPQLQVALKNSSDNFSVTVETPGATPRASSIGISAPGTKTIWICHLVSMASPQIDH